MLYKFKIEFIFEFYKIIYILFFYGLYIKYELYLKLGLGGLG